MNMAICSRWFSNLCILLISFQVSHGSRLSDTFYSKLNSLLSHLPDSRNAQESTDNAVTEVGNWPTVPIPNLGQISGVAVNPVGQPVIFHRGPRIWDYESFNDTNHFQKISEGPITVNTVLTLDPENGIVLSGWGADFFYLPHGIHVDFEGNTWLTDVALHQVFKFSLGSGRPVLSFGRRFKPGSGFGHLCKPTSVTVAQNGQIFIADGYCNSRILQFNQFGDWVRVFPQNREFASLKVPHSLTLLEQQGLLCIADRENMRVVCINSALDSTSAQTQLSIQQPDLGRVFAVANKGGIVLAVNGPTSPHLPVQGFIIDPLSESVVDRWEPSSDVFHQPHDLAVSPDGLYLYVAELEPNRLWKFNLLL